VTCGHWILYWMFYGSNSQERQAFHKSDFLGVWLVRRGFIISNGAYTKRCGVRGTYRLNCDMSAMPVSRSSGFATTVRRFPNICETRRDLASSCLDDESGSRRLKIRRFVCDTFLSA